jgi:elongation factor P--(R)-beta-lysine ligase
MQQDWRPTASLENLQLRGELLWRLRSFFHRAGLLEVHTPLLSHDVVLDRHIDPVVVPGAAMQLAATCDRDLYLQTSPEFAMKRLLAAGMPAIYQISSVFRAGERGEHHNPEFTMVEWYRVGDGLRAGVEFLAHLTVELLGESSPTIETYAHAFLRRVGVDPLSCDMTELIDLALARQLGVAANWSEHRDDWLDLLFSELIQPELGRESPTIITHYPASQSALARRSDDDPRTAERFELFIGGVELANGYHELLDAPELARRNQRVAEERRLDGKGPLPAKSRLLDAMQAGLPACSGCALGFDRLVMVAARARSIDQVLPFPIERA